MPQAFDYLYLSAHLDDAILSCGAQIFQHTMAGNSVLVITVMAGDPTELPLSKYAEALHRRWQIALDNVSARRDEDIAACARVGAEYQHWLIPECIYRSDPQSGQPLYLSDEAIFGGIDPADLALVTLLATKFKKLPLHNQLLIPLAIGNHVDHQIVRQAAEKAVDGESLAYYEDFPYISEDPGSNQVLLESLELTPDIIQLSSLATSVKIEAVACYRSQISTFFNGIQDLENQVNEYIYHAGGERIWQPPRKPPRGDNLN